MKIKLFLISILVFAASASFAQITIKAARNLSMGTVVTVKGIVTNGSELGVIRYLQDSTAGIAAYGATLSTVQRGDSIQITGTLKNYNQLTELDPLTSFTVLSTGNALPTPEVAPIDSLNENHESELVRINNATFTTNPGGTFSSNTSYYFTANGLTSSIYVRANNPLIGHVIPSGTVSLIGINSQFSYSSPTTGYQLLCRDSADIINSSSISIISSVSLDSLSTTGFALNWITDNAGTSEIFYGSSNNNLVNHLSDTTSSIAHHVAIKNASPSQLFYVKAFSVLGNDTAFSPIRVFITQSVSSGDIKVYFNHPTDHSVSTGVNAITLTNAIDDTLVKYIDRAQATIDFTMYNFNSANIANIATALNNAYTRGVVVRVIFDNAANNTGLQQLDAGIKKIANPVGSQYGIMHNKFIIFDAYNSNVNVPIVWTGSTNLTEGQINTDANSVIIIQDKSLAITYNLEFNEMFGSTGAIPDLIASKFGPDKLDNTPHEFIIGSKHIKSYFSPSDGTNDVILSEIAAATATIDIATMLITRTDIAYALQDAVNNNGVKLHILGNAEADFSTLDWSIFHNLIDTNLVEDAIAPGIMHHKFMVVDNGLANASLEVGSHNWSNAANNINDENTLVIHDETIANLYYQAFRYRFYQNVHSGISNNSNLLQVDVFPNPVSENLFVNITASQSSQSTFEIADISGRTILSKVEQVNSGKNKVKLNLSNVKSGIYILKIASKDGMYMKKFMVK
ncbi:MAG: hypothetical protein AUJ98_02610 [Bacteroidetes bacterium CG2_30_33_31]|nr:MAG: hypothetical protein AUJ98_02610 [Bacteroidetes bacterium CG2_30_33_31]